MYSQIIQIQKLNIKSCLSENLMGYFQYYTLFTLQETLILHKTVNAIIHVIANKHTYCYPFCLQSDDTVTKRLHNRQL